VKKSDLKWKEGDEKLAILLTIKQFCKLKPTASFMISWKKIISLFWEKKSSFSL
jgi:hypothetical protein